MPTVRRECRQAVIAGLVPAIQVFMVGYKQQDADGRDEPGHDDVSDETSS
jgi:hypothetical protein